MKLEMGMQIAMDWNKCSAQENVHMEPNSFRHVVWCGKACMHRTHSRTVPGPLLDTLHIVMRYIPSRAIGHRPNPQRYEVADV